MTDWTQTDIFDHGAGPRVHARMTDPESSHLTMESLGKDTSYNWRIFEKIVSLSEYGMRSVTDDDILEAMERVYQRRYQRNVIARQRGIIRELGWIERVEDVIGPNGRPVVAHVPTEQGLAVWRGESSAPLVPPGDTS